jgi:two-component system chemotaxis response regulator CheB
MAQTLNVLIADDSPTARQMLSAIVNSASDMQVVGEANNGKQAINLTNSLRPDVILMDLIMPEMNGLAATREIMHIAPTPIVVISSGLNREENNIGFEAISAGALTVIAKPVGPRDADYAPQSANLLTTLRAMAKVSVIHHWQQTKVPLGTPIRQIGQQPGGIVPPQIVGIVASTGGPAALGEIISQLPGDFSIPVVVVQHIAPDFLSALVGWLDGISKVNVEIARPGEQPSAGVVYFAPGGTHLRLDSGHRFVMSRTPDNVPHIPSGDVLLESVARSYGAAAVGVVLTGMGSDGARGLLAMHKAEAFTIAQNAVTSVVYGMPREAMQLGAVRRELGLADIPSVLSYLSKLGARQ